MKKMLKVLLVLMTVVSIAGCSSKTTTEKATKKTKTLSGNYQVEIKVKDYGTIYAEIDADTAPITVTNFVKLSKEKFYDGLTFHRIIDGFMIQCLINELSDETKCAMWILPWTIWVRETNDLIFEVGATGCIA